MAILNHEVLDFIRDEIKDNADIKAYTLAQFNKENISLFIGADERRPPEGWDVYPAIVICPLPKELGSAKMQSENSFMVTVLIQGDKRPVEVGNVTTYYGIYQIEDLSTIILNILEDAFSTKTNVDGIDIKYISAPVLNFPYYEADIVISFDTTHTIGGECSFLS